MTPQMSFDTKLRPLGVPLHIHFSVVIILLLAVTALGVSVGLGLFVLISASILFHEYGHVLVAKRVGIGVRSVVFHGLGGAANMDAPLCLYPPKDEIRVALAGPAASAILAAASYPLYAMWPENFMLYYLFWVNALVGVFNLVPVFPLDGGRVLRGLLSIRKGPRKATKIAEITTYILASVVGAVSVAYGQWLIAIIMGLSAYMAWQERTNTEKVMVMVEDELRREMVEKAERYDN